MNAVTKASAFPATVQPGLPKLGRLPAGWSREPIGKHLREVRRPVKMIDDAAYRLVTAKRARGGIVPREELPGREIAVKSQFRIEEGDFLISKRQIVHGACGIVPAELGGAIVSNEYAVLRAQQTMDTRFLTYLSHSVHFQQTCFHSAIGVHIEKMIFKLDRWLGWEFNLPPLPEQKKIADILATWDKAIETTEKLLANAEAQKQALMEHLFKDSKLRGSSRKIYHLGDIFHVQLGKMLNKTEKVGDDQKPYLTNVNIRWGRIEVGNLNYMTFSKAEREKFLLAPGDLLICEGGEVGRAAIWKGQISECYYQKSLHRLRPRDLTVRPEYLYFFMSYASRTNLLADYSTRSSIAHLTREKLLTLPVPTPSLAEQNKIIMILSACDREIELLSDQKVGLKAEKNALMQQLLTGKRRVNV